VAKPTLYRLALEDESEEEWEELGVYDSSDLEADSVYFLKAPDGTRSSVWVGSSFEAPKEWVPTDGQDGGGAADHSDDMAWAKGEVFRGMLQRTFGMDPAVVGIEVEGSESESFWTTFECGYF
jgi:hypothetical protein